jgi:hypothetical protein
MLRLIVYDGPGGRVLPYATAYDDEHEEQLFVNCLVDHGQECNARIIDNPPMDLHPGLTGRKPSRPFG